VRAPAKVVLNKAGFAGVSTASLWRTGITDASGSWLLG